MEFGASMILHRLFDLSGRTRGRVGGTWFRSAVGGGASAYTGASGGRRRRAAVSWRSGHYDVMDPFVTLTAAAAATKKLKVGTGVCLVIQRDTIQTAKLVASIDQISGGRFLFGIGGGWNAEEIESHGTKSVHNAHEEDARADGGDEGDLDQDNGGIRRRDCKGAPSMQTWPKPVQKPHPPILLGGAFPWAARRAVRYGDGWALEREQWQSRGVHASVPRDGH